MQAVEGTVNELAKVNELAIEKGPSTPKKQHSRISNGSQDLHSDDDQGKFASLINFRFRCPSPAEPTNSRKN